MLSFSNYKRNKSNTWPATDSNLYFWFLLGDRLAHQSCRIGSGLYQNQQTVDRMVQRDTFVTYPGQRWVPKFFFHFRSAQLCFLIPSSLLRIARPQHSRSIIPWASYWDLAIQPIYPALLLSSGIIIIASIFTKYIRDSGSHVSSRQKKSLDNRPRDWSIESQKLPIWGSDMNWWTCIAPLIWSRLWTQQRLPNIKPKKSERDFKGCRYPLWTLCFARTHSANPWRESVSA